MSRSLRTRFAAPLVVTLAVAPACVVHSASAPPPAGPATAGPTTADATAAPPTGPAPVEVPREPAVTDQVRPPPPTTTATTLHTWTVFRNRTDQQCYASIDVTCSPKATCNPPPPRPMESCPTGMTDQPVKIREQPGGTCLLESSPPACAPNAPCNPPRPQPVDCPS